MDIEINNRYIILHACVSSLLHKWTEEHQKAFEHIKKSISRETLLVYPDFNKPFEIHTDASKVQLGAVISQDNKPIAFYATCVHFPIEKSLGCLYRILYSLKYEKNTFNMVSHFVG